MNSVYFYRYEKAICEYERCLDAFEKPNSGDGHTVESNTSVNPTLLEFLVNEVKRNF